MIHSGAVTFNRDVGGENGYIINRPVKSTLQRPGAVLQWYLESRECGEWVHLLLYKVQWPVSMTVDPLLSTINLANILTDMIPASLEIRLALLNSTPKLKGMLHGAHNRTYF
jgi:hypothetical protein